MKRLILFVLILCLSGLSLPAAAQSDSDACETYDTVTIGSTALVDEGIDLAEVRCTTIFVENENEEITHVFVIPESLVAAYLRGVDLSGLDLTAFDLSYAILRDADLSEVLASSVMFIETDFTNADLSASDLSFAYFNFAIFQFTNFVEANLTGAELSDAFIRSADFTDATMDDVIGYESND